MDPLPDQLLDQLDFVEAATREAGAWRNLLPPEPWLEAVRINAEAFGDFARQRLEAGVTSAPSVVVRARKAHQQVRPVPVVGIAERIVYRALVSKVLEGLDSLDRSQAAYQRFVGGPIRAAFEGRERVNIGQISAYVVESDIVAFYEYIDHAHLLSEMELRTTSVQLPRVLAQFLTELQGRPFGLPQLLDPSDDLSELYGRIIERELVRRGHQVFRYNDDFRLFIDRYDHALGTVEALAQEASNVGLVLNQQKTFIQKFINYFWDNWTGPKSDGDVEFKPELIQVMNDYGSIDDEDQAEVAHEHIDRLDPAKGGKNQINLESPAPQDSRDLNMAIGVLTRLSDPYGLRYVPYLFEYAAHIGHRVGTYVVAVHGAGHDVGPIWDELVEKADLFNAWQRIWLVYIARVCRLLEDEPRRACVRAQRNHDDQLLRAEATLALAPYREVGFDDIDRAVRVEPEALTPWYALAARVIPNVNQNRLAALKEGNALVGLVLTRPPRPKRSRVKSSADSVPSGKAPAEQGETAALDTSPDAVAAAPVTGAGTPAVGAAPDPVLESPEDDDAANAGAESATSATLERRSEPGLTDVDHGVSEQ